MNPNLTFPGLLGLGDLSLFLLRLVVALVFGASGYYHLKDPVGRAKSVGLSPRATRALGAAEILGSGLILVGLGAIQKKAFQWKMGIWGNGTNGWHYDLMLLSMNLVILATGGGRWGIRL
jgi:uncharacterized membrane protein YphA (DoxX/SURF4 family)